MGGNAFSGSSQRRQFMATEVQNQAIREEQKAELDKQKAVAEDQQSTALQDSLSRDTQRLLRVFGARSLLTGGGVRAPLAAR